MRALILNCTLKPSPASSNTETLAGLVADGLREHGVTVESVRVVDHRVEPGVETNMGDDWIGIHEKLLSTEILVVVTGNEDGAHHVISEIAGALGDVGYTIPGQAWTYWNMGPGPGPDYADTDHGHDWSAKTATTMAANLYGVASALTRQPIPA